jgi:cold shock protein
MRLGTIKFFDAKGWGFIIPGDGSADIFFHASALPGKRGARTIEDGREVIFEVGEFNGRTIAKTVRPVVPENGGSDAKE